MADEQRSIEVPQIVEPEAAGTALVDRGTPELTEAVAADRAAIGIREDEVVASSGLAFDVGGERGTDDVREGRRSYRCLRLRRAELGLALAGEDELAVDSDRAAKEVDAVDAQAEALALAKPGPGGEDHQGSVALRHALRDGAYDPSQAICQPGPRSVGRPLAARVVR